MIDELKVHELNLAKQKLDEVYKNNSGINDDNKSMVSEVLKNINFSDSKASINYSESNSDEFININKRGSNLNELELEFADNNDIGLDLLVNSNL